MDSEAFRRIQAAKEWVAHFNFFSQYYRILRRIFGPKRDENGEWRGLHNEELHSLYRSPNIVGVIKSKRLRWQGM